MDILVDPDKTLQNTTASLAKLFLSLYHYWCSVHDYENHSA